MHNEQKAMEIDSLKTLDKKERLVLTMYYIDHLKYYEIAEVSLSIYIEKYGRLYRLLGS